MAEERQTGGNEFPDLPLIQSGPRREIVPSLCPQHQPECVLTEQASRQVQGPEWELTGSCSLSWCRRPLLLQATSRLA